MILRLEPSPFERLPQALRTLFAGLFFLQAACVCATLGFGMSPQADRWPFTGVDRSGQRRSDPALSDLPGREI